MAAVASLLNFLKPNREKILIMLFGYGLFYVFDNLLLGPAENFYVPSVAQQFLAAPSFFWALRFVQEITAFYTIASFAYWFLNLKKDL